MSWYKNSKESQPAAVTFERVVALLEKLEFNFQTLEGSVAIAAYFEGIPTMLVVEDANLVVRASTVGMQPAEAEYVTLLKWANQWNFDAVFGTAVIDKAEGQPQLLVDTAFLTAEGMDDDQLEQAVMIGIAHGVQAVQKYMEDFEIPALSA